MSSLVFKLFQNVHRPGAPRAGGASEDFLTSGVHIRSFAGGIWVNAAPSNNEWTAS